jgi:hypothetical protein
LGKQVEISPPKAIFLKHGQNSGKLMVKGWNILDNSDLKTVIPAKDPKQCGGAGV